MTIPAIVAGHTTKQDASATTSRTITTPTYTSGDEIFLFAVSSIANANVASSGFTALYDNQTLSGGSIFILKKTAGSEAGTYTVTSTSSILSIVGVAITPFGGLHATSTNATGTSATATAPAVVTTLANTLRISVIAADDSPGIATVATLSGHTLLATVTGLLFPTVSVQWKDLTGTGTDASQTSALSGSETWTGITFALYDLAEARATKAGVYVDILDAQVDATKAGIYIELINNQVRASVAGTYVEILLAVSPPDGDPTGLTATAISDTRIDLAWNDNSTNEDGFKIERSPNGTTGWTLIHTTAADVESYSNTGLTEATAYYYRVYAYTSVGDSAYTTDDALTYPAAPTSLDAVQAGSTQIDLTWTDNSAGETGFHIERSATGAGGWSVIGTNAANDTTYSDTGLSPGATWYYRVAAYNATGDSAYSNTDSATTLNPPTGAPSGLTADATSSSIILLNWTDGTTGETGFEVERSPNGSTGWTLIDTNPANDTSFSNTGLTEATTYYYRVRGVNADGSTSYSNTDDGLTYPAAPSVLVAFAPDDTQIDLTWSDNSAGETGQKVERSADGSTGWTLIYTAAANAESYSNTGLLPGATWYYRIGAYNASGTSYSNVDSATTSAAPQALYDIRYQVYFDWDRDGTYTSEDDYFVSARGTHRLAPPGQSITATSGQVAQCTIVMDNSTGRFSSFNTGGALYTYIQSGKTYHVPVIVQISVEDAGAVSATYNRVFTGVARVPFEATLTGDQAQTITFDCRGNEEVLLNKRTRTAQADFKVYRDSGVTEGEFMTDVLTDAGIIAGDQEIDGGLFSIPFPWIENESIVESLWQLAALCGGRFYCNKAGEYCYENATHWLSGTVHTTSQQSYTRGAGFGSLELVWDETELAQEVTVSYTERDIGQADVIYDSPNLQIGAGLEKTIYADFTAPVYEITEFAYTAGTNGGVDLSADVTVTPTHYAQSSKLVVENTNATTQANVRIKISGKPVEDGEQKTIAPESVDSFWSDKIGRTRKVSGNKWVQSEGQADMLAQLMRARQDAPTLVAKMKKCPGFSTRALGDRVTITDAELDLAATAFWITAISWSYSSKGYLQDIDAVRCSDMYPHSETSPGYFILGTNRLGSADALRARVFF